MSLHTLDKPGASPAPAKRMRLGTKSCTECRRRKVRCIYNPNSSRCQECVLHEAICVAQQPKRSNYSQEGDQQRLQQRLDELESMIRRVFGAVSPNSKSLDVSQLETQAADAISRLQTLSPDAEAFEEDAPLLQLFKQAMIVQWERPVLEREGAVPTGNTRFKNCVAALKSLLPNYDDLTLILELTEQFWPIWPLLPTKDQTSLIHQLRPVAMARQFVLELLEKSQPAVVAKGFLWLALCIQQLPRDVKRQCLKLPAPLKHLIASYLSGAEYLLTMDDELGGSIEGLEALGLVTKIYINMGKPRKAWVVARRGINQALLLGLHHIDDTTDQQKKRIWASFWQLDRHLSLVLGYPYAIADSHPSLSTEHTDGSNEALVAHRMSVIAGHIVERNQNHQNVDYFATLKIAQELEECRKIMPPQWWETPGPDMSLAALYNQQTTKIIYFQLHKYLHLPYMLKPTAECNFIDSRRPAVEASRKIVEAYQTLRGHNSSMTILCDLMDFQVFSAVIVIIINLLSEPASNPSQEQTSDWELVSYTITTLEQVAKVMECEVARQAAQLLQYILQAHKGVYAGPQAYEAVIPYFGKVRISQPRDLAATAISGVNNTGSLADISPEIAQVVPLVPDLEYTFPPEVQFCTDPFVSSTAGLGGDDLRDMELNVDWTAVIDENTDWEFNQIFNVI
ncbi:hypothetical protein CJF30_00007996 [Rutstroemia sp. NJR-2017a BBW]|nr:hypothetical protein CJF30_00007996 [Rutstroemia sp. NJR-2017a BBW]